MCANVPVTLGIEGERGWAKTKELKDSHEKVRISFEEQDIWIQ